MWEAFIPFLHYSPGIRRVIYSTNIIELLDARFRRARRCGEDQTEEKS
jgi:putative transposase